MLNLIERFFEEMEETRVFVNVPEKQAVGEQQEIYFFMGKDSVLCISKFDNKVLSKIPLPKMQISLLSATEFSLNVNGQSLFFCQSDSISTSEANGAPDASVPLDTEPNLPEQPSRVTSNDKYPHRQRCEACTNRKCSQYDAINGRVFRFGSGPVSRDLLEQHERYCKTKIEKFGCEM